MFFFWLEADDHVLVVIFADEDDAEGISGEYGEPAVGFEVNLFGFGLDSGEEVAKWSLLAFGGESFFDAEEVGVWSEG